MPITNIFATWSLGGEEEQGQAQETAAAVGATVSPAIASPFVKPREHSSITPSFFHSSEAPKAALSKPEEGPPNKIQKVFHADKGQKEQPILGSFAPASFPKKPPIPEHISFVVSQNHEPCTTFPNVHELGDLSEEDVDDEDLSQSSKSADGIKTRDLLPAPFFRYRDHSLVVDDDPLLPLTPFSKIPNFPAKLHAILSRPDLADIISWMPHGRSWRVLNPREFEIRVLPSYFEHQKLSSFIRQANGWGFHRISQGLDRNSYYHELFLRGLPHLCKKMKRPRVNQKPVVDPDHEPDFSAISEMHPLPVLLPDKLKDDLLLPSTLIGGPKARNTVLVDKDELRSAISQALSSTSAVPPKSKGPIQYSTGKQNNIGAVQPKSSLIQKPNVPLPRVPLGLNTTSLITPPLFPQTMQTSLLTSELSALGTTTTATTTNPTMSTLGMTNTNVQTPAPPLDPLSNLLFLLKNQQSASYLDASTLNPGRPEVNALLVHSLLEQHEKMRLLSASIPQPLLNPCLISPDAVSHFAAGFAAATAFHNRQNPTLSATSLPVASSSIQSETNRDDIAWTMAPHLNNITSSLEMDAAAAMSLLEDSCRRKAC